MQRGNGAVIGKQNTPTTSVATGVWALNEVQRAVLGGNWPASTIVDPYFDYTTLLLHGNGTNGAQNNTFLDSSTNNFTITRNGNTTQGTFTPYGSNWSNYCTSSSGFLSIGSSAALASNTNSFTLEFWYNSTATGNGRPLGNGTGGGYGANNWVFGSNNTAGKLEFFVYNYNTGTAMFSSTSSTVSSDGQWHHIVLVRSGTTWAFFIDGQRQGSTITSSVSFNGTSSAFNIGWSNISGDVTGFAGYLSNVRFVNGTAVYDPTQTTLTVPSGPLTAIINTSLLTCQSNRFIDNSSNAFSLTVNGSPSVQRFSPFNPTTPYAAGTIGGSGYFDGSGDFLNFTDTGNGMDLGNATASFEAWIYPAAATVVLANKSGGTANYNTTNGIEYTIALVSQQFLMYYNTGGSFGTLADPTTGRPLNQWYHIVVASNATTLSLYVNGTRVVTATAGITKPTTRTTVRIGTDLSGTYGAAYLADIRSIQGSGAYDASQSSITVPTSPLTAITNTSLLLSYTNGGIIDNAMMNDLETVGNAQISTSVSKFGGGSMYFDGTGDYLLPSSAGTNNPLALGSGDFTLEFWLNFAALGDVTVIDWRPTSTNGAYPTLYMDVGTNKIIYYANSANRITSSTVFTTSTWYHIALVRSSGSTKLYINGTNEGATYTDSTNYLAAAVRPIIGANGAGGGTNAINAYIDDLRITKGYARYTANFSVPTAPFPDQ